ncbi:MAG: hypothetical protein ACREJS_07385 [Candidatus Rokuibacteriota bacterium]
MDTMTITIESERGTRMRFQVDNAERFDLRSEEVVRFNSMVRVVESSFVEEADGRACLALAKLALDSIIEALPPEGEEDGTRS